MSTTTLPPTKKTEPVSAPKGGITDRARGERKLGWLLAGPAFFVMLAVTAYPILQAVYESLFSYRLTDPDNREFNGVANYWVILTDSLWWQSIWVTVLITVVSAFAWQFAFDINTGFVNSWFAWLPGVSADTDWFGDFGTSIFIICLAEIWKTTPFISLLLLAGLAQVPDVLQEAAQVDGATWWQRLWRVTIPNMKAAIMVALLFRTLDAFRVFDSIFIMTAGANGTESVSFLAYRQTIARLEIGLGSAVSVLLFIVVVMLAMAFIKGFKVDLSSARGE